MKKAFAPGCGVKAFWFYTQLIHLTKMGSSIHIKSDVTTDEAMSSFNI